MKKKQSKTRHSAAELHLSRQDPVLRRIIKQHGPCRLKRNRGGFETLAEIIIGQQLSTLVATRIFHRLRKLAGGRLTPLIVSRLTDTQLRSVGLSRAKAIYVRDLAAKTQSGEIAFRKLHRMPDDEVIAMLTRVKGIGPWTAQMYLMFVLGRPDVFAPGDKGIQTAMERVYRVSELKELEGFAERWKPYRTIACWYLWRALENGPPVAATIPEAARYTRE